MSNITVTQVGIMSIAKLVGTVNLIIGLAIGIIGTIVAISNYVLSTSGAFWEELLASLVILVVGLVVYPLIAFGLGWLYGVLVAFIFNVVIGVSGGVNLEIEQDTPRGRR